MNKKLFRELAIALLDNENGIPTKAYILLENIAKESDSNKDIFDMVGCQDGYFFLPENHGLV